jgi:hypothetical protein
MAEKTLTQQQLNALRIIDELASLNPSLEVDKKCLEAIYKEAQAEIQTFINDKENLDPEIGRIMNKIHSEGISSLSVEELEKLRGAMFTAFVIKEVRFSELRDQESVSNPNLGFAESIESINNTYRRAYTIKKKKQAELIQGIVTEYGLTLRLQPDQVERLQRDFSKREEDLRQSNRDKPLPLQVYAQELEEVAAKASYIPPEKLRQKGGFSISKKLQSSYEEVAAWDREEATYRKLQKEIIRQQKDVTIREDIAKIRPPYVAFEAAVAILLREKPQEQPDEIIEQTLRLAPALVGYQAPGYKQSGFDTSNQIRQAIILRHGDLAAKEAEEHIESIKNQPELLREFQRADIQRNLLQILENPSLLEKIFTHVDDNPQAKKAFEAFVNSPFFIQIYNTLKQQTDQPHGSQLQGLLNIAASGASALGGTQRPNWISPEKNPALFFMMTADRIAALRENPELYQRFIKLFHKPSENPPLPVDSQQSLLALLVLSEDPHHPLHQNLIALTKQNGMHKMDHPYHPLYIYLQKLMEFKEKHPQYHEEFRNMLITKVYTTYILGMNPDATIETLRGFPNTIPNKPITSLPRAGKTLSSVSRIASSVAKNGIKGLVVGATGVLPGLILMAGSALLKKALNYISGGLFNKVEKIANPINWIPYIVGGIFIFILIIPGGLGIASPVVTQQIVMPQFFENQGVAPDPGGPGIDCSLTPDIPECQLATCTGNCRWPLDTGIGACIVTGPYSQTHARNRLSAIDFISLDAGQRQLFGANVYTPYAGVVERVFFGLDDGITGAGISPGNYGNHVVVRTNDGARFLFGHLRNIQVVNIGDPVAAGQRIGFVDHTGYSLGVHLHYERLDGDINEYTPYQVPPCAGYADCNAKTGGRACI